MGRERDDTRIEGVLVPLRALGPAMTRRETGTSRGRIAAIGAGAIIGAGALLASCEGRISGDGRLACDDPAGLRVESIVAGTARPTVVSLTPGERRAVALLVTPLGECSAVHVAPGQLLTAAHCVAGVSPEQCEVGIGELPYEGREWAVVRRIEVHPSLDLAYLELAQRFEAVRPIDLPLELVSSAQLGLPLEAAGFGEDASGATSRLAFVAMTLTHIAVDSLLVDGDGERGVCRGDSGGPLFGTAPDGGVVLLGIVSGGDGSCVRRARFTRVDRVVDWVRAQRAAIDPPSACGRH